MHDGSDFILKNTEISYQRRILPIFCLENGGIMFLRNASFFFFFEQIIRREISGDRKLFWSRVYKKIKKYYFICQLNVTFRSVSREGKLSSAGRYYHLP